MELCYDKISPQMSTSPKISYSVVIIMALCAMIAMACYANAQGKLTEQTFSNPNIFASALGKMDSEITSQRAKAISQAEKKKGRKLTTEEMAKVDKAIAEARKKSRRSEGWHIHGHHSYIPLRYRTENAQRHPRQ